jgi:anti-sigma factor RsiW
MEAHLSQCAACSAQARERMIAKRALRGAALRYAPSADFHLRIEKSLQRGRNPLRGFHWLPQFAAAAAALALIAVSVVLWTRHVRREQALAELVDMHVTTLASAAPVDVISTDRHTVKPWFQGKLPFTFNLPELRDSGYRLVGGKLVFEGQSPGAQLIYELRKHQISVFIVQQQGSALGDSGVRSDHERGFCAESWTAAGLQYTVVGDTGAGDIDQLGQLLRSAASQ